MASGRRLMWLLLCLGFVSASGPAADDLGTVPWQPALLRGGDLSDLHSVSAQATVSVSDGLEFQVTTHYRGPRRAVFHLVYPDRRSTLGIDGHYVWEYDGQQEKEGGPFLRQVVLGHQFHAALLFLPQVFGATASAAPVPREAGCDCMTRTYADDAGNRYRYRYDAESRLPIGSTTSLTDGTNIDVLYDDWRELGGFYLPYRIEIDDGSRTFTYRFDEIGLNRDRRAALRAPYDKLSDRQQLLRLHRLSMDAHLDGDASQMRDQWADEVVFVSRGEILTQTGAEADAFMTRSLNARRHSVYEDLEPPRIEISADGTLATVSVRVRAVGHGLGDDGAAGTPFRFVSAWTSVYRKQDGRWRLISNTSNFEPAAAP